MKNFPNFPNFCKISEKKIFPHLPVASGKSNWTHNPYSTDSLIFMSRKIIFFDTVLKNVDCGAVEKNEIMKSSEQQKNGNLLRNENFRAIQ